MNHKHVEFHVCACGVGFMKGVANYTSWYNDPVPDTCGPPVQALFSFKEEYTMILNQFGTSLAYQTR